MRWLSLRSNSAREEIASTSLSPNPLLMALLLSRALFEKAQGLVEHLAARHGAACLGGGGQGRGVDGVQFHGPLQGKVVVHARQIVGHTIGGGQQLAGKPGWQLMATGAGGVYHFLPDRLDQRAA